MSAVRLSCFARNGFIRGPRGPPRGVAIPGEESRSADIAAQAIEAQPVFGQIRPSRGQVRPSAEQHLRRRRGGCGCSHKMSDGSGVEKETMAQVGAGVLVAEWPLSNSPHDDQQWAIDRNASTKHISNASCMLHDLGT